MDDIKFNIDNKDREIMRNIINASLNYDSNKLIRPDYGVSFNGLQSIIDAEELDNAKKTRMGQLLYA